MPDTTDTTTLVSASDLARVLHNAHLFTSKDKARPTLMRVELNVSSNTLEVVGTDSYMLGRDTCPINRDTGPSESVARTLHRDVCAEVVAKCKKESGATIISIHNDNGAVVVTGPAWSITDIGHGEPYIQWRTLMPTTEPAPTPSIALSPAKLSVLAKVKHDMVDTAARFEFWGDMKPALVRIGATFSALIMPVHRA